MKLNKKLICLYLSIGFVFGVIAILRQQRPMDIAGAQASAVVIDSTYDDLGEKAQAYQAYLEPIKEDLDRTMNTVIGVAEESMRGGRPESLLSNWTSDVILAAANAVSDDEVHMSVMNMGGLRCEIPKGDIHLRKVFELMPFDNELVILTLTGQDIMDLCDCFASVGGEGVGGVRFEIRDGKAYHIEIAKKRIDPKGTYRLATSNYLAEGNDNMMPLTRRSEVLKTGILLRDVFHEAIVAQKTVGARLDKRIDVGR